MLQNMNFHVSLTYGSFSSTLSGRETRQVNPSWAKDVLGSAAPTKSRAVHLLFSSFHLRGLYYTIQGAKTKKNKKKPFALQFKLCYATFGIKCLPLPKNDFFKSAYNHLKEKCSKIQLWRK